MITIGVTLYGDHSRRIVRLAGNKDLPIERTRFYIDPNYESLIIHHLYLVITIDRMCV